MNLKKEKRTFRRNKQEIINKFIIFIIIYLFISINKIFKYINNSKCLSEF